MEAAALAADGGLGGPSKSKEDAVNTFYQGAIEAVRPHLPSLPLILSFIPPSAGVMTFLAGLSSSEPHMVDHHFYLNWLDVDPATRVVDPTNPDDPKWLAPVLGEVEASLTTAAHVRQERRRPQPSRVVRRLSAAAHTFAASGGRGAWRLGRWGRRWLLARRLPGRRLREHL